MRPLFQSSGLPGFTRRTMKGPIPLSWLFAIALIFQLFGGTASATGGEEGQPDGLTQRGTTGRGWLGIGFQYFDSEFLGRKEGRLLILGVAPGSPAKSAGLLPQDIVVAIDGKKFVFAGQVAALDFFGRFREGDRVRLTVRRGQIEVVIALCFGRLTEERALALIRSYRLARAADERASTPR
jgi:S1-C subfamily serine protease